MPDRMGPLRTLAGRFVERINDGTVSRGAGVVSAADAGVAEVALGAFEGAPTVPGEFVSLVTSDPRRMKVEIEYRLEPTRTLVLVPGEAVEADRLVARRDGPAGIDRVVDLRDLLPAESWVPTDGDGSPGQDWLTQRASDEKIEISVEKVERAKLAPVSTGGSSWEEVFGLAEAALPGRPPEPGEEFDPARTLMTTTGDALLSAWPDDGPPRPERFEVEATVPTPAPLGGVSFGVGVLSTPTASVLGESANPLAELETDELLQRDEVKRLLSQAGVGEGTEIELAQGLERVPVERGPTATTLLGAEAEIESFVAVLGGEAAGWGVGVHLLREDADDHVTVVGVHRHAVGTGDDAMAAMRESAALGEARRLLAETARKLTAG